MQSEYCQQCRQPLEEWEAGICEGCGVMRNILEDLLMCVHESGNATIAKRTKLRYQHTADNSQIACMIAGYLVSRLGHMKDDVAVDGCRVLHDVAIEGMQAERLRSYVDGLRDCFCGES